MIEKTFLFPRRLIFEEDNEEVINVNHRFYLYDTFMFDKKTSSLFLGDLHIGLEEYYRSNGIYLPRTLFRDLMQRLEKAITYFNSFGDLQNIIFLGDVKHEFGTISRQEWYETLKLIDSVSKYNLILIKGNHDTILEPITRRFNIEIENYFFLEDLFLIHGHQSFEELIKKHKLDIEKLNQVNYIVMGHEHPAITLRKFGRTEKFKCYLFGKCDLLSLIPKTLKNPLKKQKKYLVVLPSAHNIQEGTDLLRDTLISPVLQNINLTNFYVLIIYDSKVYNFSKLKNIKKLIHDLS